MEILSFEVPMTEKESDIQNTPKPQQNDVGVNSDRKQSKPLLKLFLVFVVFVVVVFLLQDRDQINWILDYDSGIDLAKKENKPVLLAFHQKGSRFSILAFDDTYKDAKVKEFVERNFIPILIYQEKQPDLARKYDVNYSLVHLVIKPDSDERYGPRLGHDRPDMFIVEMKKLMKQADLSIE
jgi:hypothetical protein